MIDWTDTEFAVDDAKGIAFDTCHKIYVLMDTEQVEQMREYEYELIHTSEEMTPSQMLATLHEWFEKSCPLRFIQSVATVSADDEDSGYETLIEQGATDEEECEECYTKGCNGDCEYDEEEDEDDEEEEEE